MMTREDIANNLSRHAIALADMELRLKAIEANLAQSKPETVKKELEVLEAKKKQTVTGDWTEGFEGFLQEQVHVVEMANRNHPCEVTGRRWQTLKMVLDAFRRHRSEACHPTCITDPRSHFDWLVRFIEDVKQDSLNHYGVAQESAFETCRVILEHAEFIRKQGN